MEEKINIYEKYGGFDFFHSCIYSLYLDMFDHPEISYHFIGVDIEKLSLHQAQFLVRAIGGPDFYKGKPIKNVHRFMQITPYEFNEIAVSFRKIFIDKGVDEKDVDFIMNFVGSHRPDIVTSRSNFMDRLMRPFYIFLRKISKRFFK